MSNAKRLIVIVDDDETRAYIAEPFHADLGEALKHLSQPLRTPECRHADRDCRRAIGGVAIAHALPDS